MSLLSTNLRCHIAPFPPTARTFRGIAYVILSISGLLFNAAVADAGEKRVTFFNSVGSMRPNVAATARALEAKDLAGNLDFSVSLQMRDLAGLEARVANGEVISRLELEQRYLPLEADYNAVRAWLITQGITVMQDDASRLSVFARGTVAQVQTLFQVGMVKVTSEGSDYPAASGHPSLPATVSGAVAGVNGLHPYHRLHKHSHVNPQAVPSSGYRINNILTTYDAASTGLTGAGQTIAILIDATPLTSDLATFWTNNNSPQTTDNVTTINVNNTAITTREGEETLDVEWAGGIAPGAKIRVYATGGLNDTQLDSGLARILSDAKSDSTIRQLSISLGEGETYEPDTSQFTTDHNYFVSLASQGVSTFVSSGDGGSTPDDLNTGPRDTGPLQVEYYSSDSSVTAVGGTSLNVVSTSDYTRSTETAWSGSGGGVSVKFSKPHWQTGGGVPAVNSRCVPDVAMPADPNTGAYVYYNGRTAVYGGTSWSAPTWAGFCALINQARANAGTTRGLGLVNPSLYRLLGTDSFHDITSGSNAEGANAAGKYSTSASYDLVTGIGVPNVKNLVFALGGSLTAFAPTITGFSPSSGPVGTSVTITGTNLASPTAVSFNGKAATVTSSGATQVVATVPAGATTGTITVATSGGTSTSTGSFTVTVPGNTMASGLVISQVYGGGGATTGSASYASDYVELFNPTSAAINLGGYSVQSANRSSNTYAVTPLTGSIAARHYYLVKGYSGSVGAVLPTADATGANTLNMSANNGKVALVSKLTAITASTDTAVVDFVGYGSANEYEGSGAAPALTTTTADFRGNAGYTDTNQNSSDFATNTPAPRNSASAASPGTAPDLTVAIAHNGTFTQADAADTYTITATNSGTATTSETVSVAVAVPTGLTATSLSGAGWTINNSTLVATRGDALGAGGSYPVLTLTVQVSSTAPASVTTTATVAGGGETNTANDTAGDAAPVTALTPSQSWRYTYFGITDNTGNAADTANPAGDGINNLLKYALGLDPRSPAVNPIMADVSTGYLRLTVPRSSSATDVTMAVQVNGDLTNAAGWTTTGTTMVQNTPMLLQVRDDAAVSSGGQRFIRLVVTRP